MLSEMRPLYLSKYNGALDINEEMLRKWLGIYLLESTFGVMLNKLIQLLAKLLYSEIYICSYPPIIVVSRY